MIVAIAEYYVRRYSLDLDKNSDVILLRGLCPIAPPLP